MSSLSCRTAPCTDRRNGSAPWTTTHVDRSAYQRRASSEREPVSLSLADPNSTLSRADRRAMIIMQVVEAAKFQRECSRPTSVQRRALDANSALVSAVSVPHLIANGHGVEEKAPLQAYSLLTARSLKNLVSDVKTLLNPKLAKDYTTGTVTQVCKLGLYQASLLPLDA